jgi:hypothetical protein
VSNANGNKEVNGDGNKGGGRVTATVKKRAKMMATRVAGNKEGNGNCGKSNGNGCSRPIGPTYDLGPSTA